METPIYMKIAGISGDSTEQNHKQWIQLSHLDFNVTRRISAQPGHIANRESSRPALSELTIIKPMDSASSLLFGESCTGKAKPQVTIDCCKTGANGFSPVAQLTLENVLVSGYQLLTETTPQDPSNPSLEKNTQLLEKITLSFDKIEMKTIPYGSDGAQKTPISYGYDMKVASAA